MAEEGTGKWITSAELGIIIGKTDRSIQALAKTGVISCKKERGRNLYDLYTVIQEYIAYLAKSKGKKNSSKEEQKLDEEVRLKRAKADMAELELDELRGVMHRSDDVEAAFNALIFEVRNMLMAMPGRIALDVVKAETPAEASALIARECADMLNDLSTFQYDPEEYKEKVRQRHGYAQALREPEEAG